MAFKIIFSEEALHQLRKLEKRYAKRMMEKIREAGKNPNHYFERLSGRGEYKLRAGDYRIIANVLHNSETIVIRTLGHRKNVYER